MGNSHSVTTALHSVLKQREIKVSTRTLETFIREIERISPWYACSGSLTLSSWEKLREDLAKEQQNGKLKAGTMPLWKLVRSCLEDERCHPAIITGQAILEEVQDSMAETEWCERLRALKKENVHKEKSPSRDLESEEVKNLRINPQGEKKEKEKVQKRKSLYPVKELEALKLDSLKADELSSSEEEESHYEAAHYKKERYHPEERRVKKSEKKLKVTGDTEQATSGPSSLNTPPPYVEKFYSDSFLSKEEKKKLYQAFPVFEAADGGRVHAPVEYTQIKELAESVRNYGVSANFTISQIERFATLAMTPGDWQTTVKAALPNMGQYMEWKALWHDASQTQAKVNATAEGNQRNWTFELLTGQGQYANNQTNYDWGAYNQISTAAIKAWKALSKKGESGRYLTKIIQNPQESFSDFVARMTEAAGRIFGDSEQAMPLVEQLIYEQATQECRAAITPRKSKGLQDWLRVCRELGGPLSNAGLAAAILQGQRRSDTNSNNRVCYNCGKPGHMRRDCQALVKGKVLGLCTRCGKGYHRASECRSIKDVRGRFIQSGPQAERSEDNSKNEFLGPRSQGPKTYGIPAHNRRTLQSTELQKSQQEWISVPSLDSC